MKKAAFRSLVSYYPSKPLLIVTVKFSFILPICGRAESVEKVNLKEKIIRRYTAMQKTGEQTKQAKNVLSKVNFYLVP